MSFKKDLLLPFLHMVVMAGALPYAGGTGMCRPSGCTFEDMCSLRVYYFANFSCLCSLRYAFQPHGKLCVPSGYTISRYLIVHLVRKCSDRKNFGRFNFGGKNYLKMSEVSSFCGDEEPYILGCLYLRANLRSRESDLSTFHNFNA